MCMDYMITVFFVINIYITLHISLLISYVINQIYTITTNTLLDKIMCDSSFLCQHFDLIHSHFKTDRVMLLYFSRVSNGMLAIIVGIFVKNSESYNGFYRSYVQQQLICTQI